jgi:hypothetical protein
MDAQKKLAAAYRMLELAAGLVESAGWPGIAAEITETANAVDAAEAAAS